MAVQIKTVAYTGIPILMAGIATWVAKSKPHRAKGLGEKTGRKLESITSEATRELRKAVSGLQTQVGPRNRKRLAKQLDRTVNQAGKNIGKAIDHVQKQVKHLSKNGKKLSAAVH